MSRPDHDADRGGSGGHHRGYRGEQGERPMALVRSRDPLGNNGDVLGYYPLGDDAGRVAACGPCGGARWGHPQPRSGEGESRAIEHSRRGKSGQGHRIFVEELARFVAEVGNPRYTAIADQLTTPLRVAVSGRRAVGSSTVEQALARVDGVPGSLGKIAVTTSSKADLDVYVIAEVVKPEDRDALVAAGRPVLVVLNKADLIGPPQRLANLHEPTTAAKMRCARLAHLPGLTGVAIEPVVGLLAVAALDGLVDGPLWAALQVLATQPADLSSPDSFLAGEHVVPVEVRRRMLDTLDVFGITQVIAAIRQGATAGETRARLRRLSCVDRVVDRIGAVGAQVYYRRMLDAVVELETLAVTDRRVGEFLSRDDTVIARMAAAVDVVEEAGMAVDRCDSASAHVRRAVGWQRYSRGPVAGVHRACGADIVRGSLRLWSKVACGGERCS